MIGILAASVLAEPCDRMPKRCVSNKPTMRRVQSGSALKNNCDELDHSEMARSDQLELLGGSRS